VAAAALVACAVLVPSEAHAGTTSPLSAIAALPSPTAIKAPEATSPVVGAVVKSRDAHRGTQWHEITAATGRGYCVAAAEGGHRWLSTYGVSSGSSAEDLDVDRLVEKDGKATLERTRVRFEPSSGSLTATGRSHVELREIARTPAGIVVWAYRQGKDIVVLTRNVERGLESRKADPEQSDSSFIFTDGCPFAGARLDARKPESGGFVQLSGNLPARGTGKEKVVPRFIVDSSLSRVTHDPEPMLSVRVRVREGSRDSV
jgi:hypothetical protein